MNQKPTPRAYKVNLSKGDPIPVDAEELPDVLQAIKSGMPCRVKRGVFNPSYYVSITEDRERVDEIEHHNAMADENNERVKKYGGTLIGYKGLQPLKDIFEGIDLKGKNRKQIPPKRLETGDNYIERFGNM